MREKIKSPRIKLEEPIMPEAKGSNLPPTMSAIAKITKRNTALEHRAFAGILGWPPKSPIDHSDYHNFFLHLMTPLLQTLTPAAKTIRSNPPAYGWEARKKRRFSVELVQFNTAQESVSARWNRSDRGTGELMRVVVCTV